MSKESFMAKHAGWNHLEDVFSSDDTQAQEMALSHNPLVTRKHVEIGMKSPNEIVRRLAYTHQHATDDDLKSALRKDKDYNNQHFYKKEIEHRKWIRDGVVRPAKGDKHWDYYKQTYGKDDE